MEGISNQQTWIVILETHYFVFKRTYPLHKCNHQFAIKPRGEETQCTIVVMLIFLLFFSFSIYFADMKEEYRTQCVIHCNIEIGMTCQ